MFLIMIVIMFMFMLTTPPTHTRLTRAAAAARRRPSPARRYARSMPLELWGCKGGTRRRRLASPRGADPPW
eukprot:gene1189-8480_t